MLNGAVMFLETTFGVIAPDQIAAGTNEKAMKRTSGKRYRKGRFQSYRRAKAELTKRSKLSENGVDDARCWKERLMIEPVECEPVHVRIGCQKSHRVHIFGTALKCETPSERQ